MSGFGGFGANPPGGGLFGAKPPDQNTGGFSIPTTTTTTTTTGMTFGTPTFGWTGGFSGQQQTPGFSGFGAKPPTTAAATTTTGTGLTGFTFGTPATNTTVPTFGSFTANTGAPTFGTSTPSTNVLPLSTCTPNTNIPTFGSSTTATTLPSFGSFGSSTTGFGTLNAPKTTPTTGFTLPTSVTTTGGTACTTTTATPMFSFGMTSAATTTAPLSFGLQTTATTSTPTLTFGTPATSTTAATTTAAQTTGFSFTQPSTTASFSFGVAKTTAGLTFGTGTPGFSASTTTTTTPTFNLGTSTTTSTLGTGLFGTSKTTDSASVTTSTTTTTTTLGLGGVNYKQTTQGLSGSGTTEPKQAKDHILPDPILQTLNDFQNFTKQQKSISVEISHGSSKPLKKVQEDTEAMESLLTMITSGLTRNAIAVDKLKTETAQGLHQAEMAQRNHETPPGLEYDNTAPSDYFNDLVTKFETDTARLRVQIEASEKHLKSLTQSSTISPQELTLAMRRLHETLIVLAARVQALHTSVQSQKEQYKNLRRVYFKDDSNVFESEADQSIIKKQTIYSLRSLTGPTPFSDTPGAGPPLNVDCLAMLASSAAIPTTSSNPSWMSEIQGTANTSLLPNSTLLASFQPLNMPGFQLSNPPTGNKRSRH